MSFLFRFSPAVLPPEPDAGDNNNPNDDAPHDQHAVRPVIAVCLDKHLDGFVAALLAERHAEEGLGDGWKTIVEPEILVVGLDRVAALVARQNARGVEDEHQERQSSVDSEEPRRVAHLVRGAKQSQCECGDKKRRPRDTGNNVHAHSA